MRYLEEGMSNVLLATDFSQTSKRGFDAAVRLARAFDARLHILHVNEEDDLFGSHSSEEVNAFLREVVSRRARWMDTFESVAAEQGVTATPILRDGRPAETILSVADEIDADILVVGTQGARGIGNVLPGSVARKVLRGAERPVLVVSRNAGVAPVEDGGTFDNVVYPTDFSQASRSGLEQAELFAHHTGCKLSLLHVLRMPELIPAMPGEEPMVIPQSVADRLRTELEGEMAELVAGLDTEHVESFVAVSANAADGICDMVQQAGADLIMIPRHSSHGARTVLFGRTAENLAKIAPVPVLLFHPR